MPKDQTHMNKTGHNLDTWTGERPLLHFSTLDASRKYRSHRTRNVPPQFWFVKWFPAKWFGSRVTSVGSPSKLTNCSSSLGLHRLPQIRPASRLLRYRADWPLLCVCGFMDLRVAIIAASRLSGSSDASQLSRRCFTAHAGSPCRKTPDSEGRSPDPCTTARKRKPPTPRIYNLSVPLLWRPRLIDMRAAASPPSRAPVNSTGITICLS